MPRTPATLIMRPLVFMGGGLRYATRRDGTKPSAPCVLPSRPGPRRLHAHFFEAHGEEIAARATRAAGLLDGCLHPGPLGLSPRSAAQSRADERSLPASAAPPRERGRASEPAEVSLDAKRSHADGLLAVEGQEVLVTRRARRCQRPRAAARGDGEATLEDAHHGGAIFAASACDAQRRRGARNR